jgi:hypothetical protein
MRVAQERPRIHAPTVCRWCQAAGTVVFDAIIVGGAVCLKLVCQSCDHRWSPTPDEIHSSTPDDVHPVDRRSGQSDRRRRTRADRRKTPR